MSDSRHVDAFLAYEVLHLASVIAGLFEEHIEQHPFTQSDPELRAAADRLNMDLADFYQLVGGKTVSGPTIEADREGADGPPPGQPATR